MRPKVPVILKVCYEIIKEERHKEGDRMKVVGKGRGEGGKRRRRSYHHWQSHGFSGKEVINQGIEYIEKVQSRGKNWNSMAWGVTLEYDLWESPSKSEVIYRTWKNDKKDQERHHMSPYNGIFEVQVIYGSVILIKWYDHKK